jgi:soluble lytic murein transglycosylase-like protein
MDLPHIDILKLIREEAEKEGIDPYLWQAICTVESSLNPMAVRYEPHYRWLYFVPENASRLGVSRDTEEVLQKMSFGLCQVMGAVMREAGFAGQFGECFKDPKIPLIYGLKHFKKYVARYQTMTEAVSAYNQGSNKKSQSGMFLNQSYVDKVYKIYSGLTKID